MRTSMERHVGSSLAVILLSVALPAMAAAQAPPTEHRWFIGGMAGGTFGTVSGAAIGVQGGARIAPGLFLVGEVARLQNVLPKTIRDEMLAYVNDLASDLNVPITLDFSMRATTTFAGVRWAPVRRSVAPFVEGGIGTGSVGVHVSRFLIFGNDYRAQLGDSFADLSATKLLVALGGGVTGHLRPNLTVDAGYRFTRIAAEDPALNISRIYVAFNVGK